MSPPPPGSGGPLAAAPWAVNGAPDTDTLPRFPLVTPRRSRLAVTSLQKIPTLPKNPHLPNHPPPTPNINKSPKTIKNKPKDIKNRHKALKKNKSLKT